jgi:hypothetical protein
MTRSASPMKRCRREGRFSEDVARADTDSPSLGWLFNNH